MVTSVTVEGGEEQLNKGPWRDAATRSFNYPTYLPSTCLYCTNTHPTNPAKTTRSRSHSTLTLYKTIIILDMSFLYSATPALRTSLRRSVITQSPRLFSTTLVQQKGPVEAAKDGLKTVDRAVSDAAVAGIDKGGMSTHSPDSRVLRFVTMLTTLIQSSSKTKQPRSPESRPARPKAKPPKSQVKPRERPTNSQDRPRARRKKSRERCRDHIGFLLSSVKVHLLKNASQMAGVSVQ